MSGKGNRLKSMHIKVVLKITVMFQSTTGSTCESRADASTIHSAVTGAGLTHYFIKRQMLGVSCQEKSEFCC